jgi:hypothetical protein
MTKEELYNRLEYTDHSREKRTNMAAVIISEPDLITTLLQMISKVNDPISCKASWILERVIRKDIQYIYPHLDNFTTLLAKIKLDSAIRPMAKICEILIITHYSKTVNNSKDFVTNVHLERIASACFDWLIGSHKVAAKAYSMTSLFLLDLTFDWIHPELKMILEQNYASGSAAYKARARMTLKKIKSVKKV